MPTYTHHRGGGHILKSPEALRNDGCSPHTPRYTTIDNVGSTTDLLGGGHEHPHQIATQRSQLSLEQPHRNTLSIERFALHNSCGVLRPRSRQPSNCESLLRGLDAHQWQCLLEIQEAPVQLSLKLLFPRRDQWEISKPTTATRKNRY